MADRKDLDFTYSLIDRLFRLSLGEMADFSGAKYDGDLLDDPRARRARKHDYISEQARDRPGRRVLDLGVAGARCRPCPPGGGQGVRRPLCPHSWRLVPAVTASTSISPMPAS